MKSLAISLLLSLLAAVSFTTVTLAEEIGDALVLALEVSGHLVAPPEIAAQLEADLSAIRTCYPYFEDIHVFPDWRPGQLLVGLTDEAWEEFLTGDYHGWDALNEQYGPFEITRQWDSIRWLMLTFTQNYHPAVLALIYEEIEGICAAEPNYTLGDGDDIFTELLGTYHFRNAWGDCPAGCMNEHIWTFQVLDGAVHLLEHHGDYVEDFTGIPSRTEMVKPYLLLANYPNPFNPAAMIPYHLDSAGWAELRIVDGRGRIVRSLINEFRPAGTHAVRWDGIDARGRPAASGTYYSSLRVGDGQWVSRPMTLLK